MEVVYRIRRLSDNLYSTGGCNPKFKKLGKAWSTIGNLKLHLKEAVHKSRWTTGDWRTGKLEYFFDTSVYDGCVIESYVLSPDPHPQDVGEFVRANMKPRT